MDCCNAAVSPVRGFHVYKAVWTPVVNSEHSTQQEHGNSKDNYSLFTFTLHHFDLE